jgi:aminoglycoside phosphotransferase (APT) family kinase protein
VGRRCARPQPCLIHWDPPIGNYFFDSTGAGRLDWQLCTSGHWASDVVYAIASAMEIHDRRANEGDLLRHYLDQLASRGAHPPTFDAAWLAYREFALWGFIAF